MVISVSYYRVIHPVFASLELLSRMHKANRHLGSPVVVLSSIGLNPYLKPRRGCSSSLKPPETRFIVDTRSPIQLKLLLFFYEIVILSSYL
jgi:hypothetical protein